MRFIFAVTTVLVSLAVSAAPAKTAAGVEPPPRPAVLVTGASSGIGRTIAVTLAEQGLYVYAGARKARDIEALTAIPNVQGIRLDVTVQSEIDNAVTLIRTEGRGLFGLVNNAGVALFEPLIEVSEADMQFLMDVNLFGPYRVTKAFAPLLIESKGRVTSTGSISGIVSGRFFGPYSMSKHAMEAYTDALAQEMAKFDVSVSIVEPGNFDSDIMRNLRRRKEVSETAEEPSLYEAEMSRFAPFTNEDRSGHANPGVVAEAVLHFMTSDAPKRRYLVVPAPGEAVLAIRSQLQRLVQLNADQPHELDRTQLIEMLDELLARTEE